MVLGAEHAGATQDTVGALVGSGWFSNALGHAKRIAGMASAAHAVAKQYSPQVKEFLRSTGNEHAKKAVSAIEALGMGKPQSSLSRRLM